MAKKIAIALITLGASYMFNKAVKGRRSAAKATFKEAKSQ